MAENLENAPAADEAKAPAAGQQQQVVQVDVDDTHTMATYSNFCRVTGTPEELVLDFGLNTQMTPVPTEPIKLSHRLVLNYFTAKRLASALFQALQQHEMVYGVLEVDVNKRARRPAQGGLADFPGGARIAVVASCAVCGQLAVDGLGM